MSPEDCVRLLEEEHGDLLEEVEELAANIQLVSLLIEHQLRNFANRFYGSKGLRLARESATVLLPQEKTVGSAKHLEDHCKLVLSSLCSGALQGLIDYT